MVMQCCERFYFFGSRLAFSAIAWVSFASNLAASRSLAAFSSSLKYSSILVLWGSGKALAIAQPPGPVLPSRIDGTGINPLPSHGLFVEYPAPWEEGPCLHSSSLE